MNSAAHSFTFDAIASGGLVEHAAPAAAAKWNYDALETKGHRKPAPARIDREDVALRGDNRTRLAAGTADIVRNFAIAAWAIRQHLNYVARFEFRPATGDEGLDRDIQSLMEIQSRPNNFDRGGRFSREKMFRIAEARRVIDGDTGLLMLRGGAVQGFEADLIKNPENVDLRSSHEWIDGVEIDGAGFPRRYALWGRERGGIGKKFRRMVAAENFILYGFFERYASDQIRGVSPIVAALNPLRDVYENIDYALVRSKLAQLFAIAITRSADANAFDNEFKPAVDDPDTEDVDESAEDSDGCDANKSSDRVLDLSGGPKAFDLDKGEGIEVIESKTPSAELQAFSRLVVMIALKALDLPYSFFDEAHTNYSGARGSWLHYERACLDRRDDQLEMRRRWTVFQMQRWILDGALRLPRGKTLGDLRWQWIPKGMPWWKPAEELTADLHAIAAGLSSPQKVAAKNDCGDVRENLRETAAIMKFAHDLGNQVLGVPMQLNFDREFPSEIHIDPQASGQK